MFVDNFFLLDSEVRYQRARVGCGISRHRLTAIRVYFKVQSKG